MKRRVTMQLSMLVSLLVSVLIVSCVTMTPPGSPETGYTITGFVGESPEVPAASEPVTLLDGNSERPITSDTTNFFGKYTFAGLPPGLYILQVRKIKWAVLLQDRSERLDIDLSAPEGAMNYGGHYAKKAFAEKTAAQGSGAKVGTTPPAGNDAKLAEQMAGIWWGYSGSTERKIALCPDGSYNDYRESGYSGSSADSLGNQTMAWGTASQGGGSGSWSIQGTTEQGTITVSYNNGKQKVIQYRQCGDRGCLLFDGNKLCRSGSCN
ncbi:MAG: hypothetical protein BM485_02505 [Desulfobulbaceae bacterium DB1]|nr:MAG: hypothetical protein BM485_02505 [Desulfobulbaceae bacterium DB1]